MQEKEEFLNKMLEDIEIETNEKEMQLLDKIDMLETQLFQKEKLYQQ